MQNSRLKSAIAFCSENGMPLKLLFLDVDGVISTPASHWKIDETRMAILQKLFVEPNAFVILSSSWRWHDLETTLIKNPSLADSFVGEKMIGVTKRLRVTRMMGLSTDTSLGVSCPRGTEIQEFIQANISNQGVEYMYAIVDDDSDMIYNQRHHFVETDCMIGLTDTDVEKLAQILDINIESKHSQNSDKKISRFRKLLLNLYKYKNK